MNDKASGAMTRFRNRLTVDDASLVERIEKRRARVANPWPEDDAFSRKIIAAFLAEDEGELARRSQGAA